jgi:hypothetical protein
MDFYQTLHKDMCQRRGLSEETTRSELCAFQKEQARVYACKQEGLPEDSTWEIIACKRTRDACIFQCQQRNLPETSTWADITVYDCTKKPLENVISLR